MIVRDGHRKLMRAAWICTGIFATLTLEGCTKKTAEVPAARVARTNVQASAQDDDDHSPPAPAIQPKTGAAPQYPPSRPVVYADPKENREINVTWMFNYVNFPGRVNVYEVDPDFSYDLGETRAVKKGEPLPFIRPLKMPFRLKLPGQLALALAIENDTDQPWHFFANFHNYLPTENGYGVVISCVCTNHVFAVPPHSTWYRIVNVRGLKIAKDGSATVIKHDIVGLTQEEIRKRKIERAISYPEE